MILALVVICFTLSGFAALLYQTAWMRLFAIAFGTSEVAVAVVLAGYMAGLALGAAVAARYVDRLKRPVMVYGVLEGAIAIAALALPVLVALTGELYGVFAGGQASPPDASTFEQPLYYSVASFLVLLIPTALMGATLPLLARYVVTTNNNLGSRVSMLYSMNTMGAVGGTLVAGFLLLPALGLRGTVWVGVAVNGLVFLVAVVLARYAARQQVGESLQSGTAAETSAVGYTLILPLILASGITSFIYEVLWTRMLSHVLGSSIYAFATMLSAFLTGIAIGAAGAGLVARNPRQAIQLFAVSQFGIGLASAFVYSRLEDWAPAGISHVLFAFAVILPSAIFIGATYPLAVRAHAGGIQQVGRSTAIVYSWNTVGSIVGALAGGFVIIPLLGFAGTAKATVVINLILGCAALAMLARSPARKRQQLWQLAAACSIALVVLLAFSPGRPDALVTRALFGGSGQQTVSEVYYAVGRSSTVFMTENQSRFDLSTNGLPEAQIEFKGAPPVILSQRWLGLWPTLARPEAREILVVGLGGGNVVEDIPASVRSIDVVELESEVIAANQAIASRRARDPLADPRVNVVVNDARNALRLTSRRYDAIVSQPSHPWTAGASHLFTREFFALVKRRLKEDGVFVQWMNAEFLDEQLLRQLAATLLAEFKNVRIYEPGTLALHFVASDGPLELERQMSSSGLPIADQPELFARNGINGPADLVSALLLDDKGVHALAKGAAIITDDDNRMAVDSNMQAFGLNQNDLTAITAQVDPLLDSDSWLRRGLNDDDLAYVAWRLARDGRGARVDALIRSDVSRDGRLLLRAIQRRTAGRVQESLQILQEISPASPVFEQAAFLRIVDRLNEFSSGALTLEDLKLESIKGGALHTVLQGWQAMAVADWQAIYALDARLHATRMSDLWASHAAQLRALWRLRAVDADGALAEQALLHIDRALATNPTLGVYSLRAEAALKLRDDSMFVESVAALTGLMQSRLWLHENYATPLSTAEVRSVASALAAHERELDRIIGVEANGRASRVLIMTLELRAELDIYQ